jgi:transcriptional regulator with XRE-family HTH domain
MSVSYNKTLSMSSPNMKRFGEKLRALRQHRGLTLREVGSMLGVYHNHISQLEFGKRTPNAAMILKIADLFGVSTDVLMRDELELHLGTDASSDE